MTVRDLRVGALVSAILVYGVWGTPTPDDPGWPEAVVGTLLVIAVGISRTVSVFTRPAPPRTRHQPAIWPQAALGLLIYGLTVPVVTGFVAGHSLTLIIRDIIPFLFMMLPLLMIVEHKTRRTITGAVVLAGLFFAARVIGPPFLSRELYTDPARFDLFSQPADPFYLANAPTVLFAALLLLGYGGARLFHSLAFTAQLKGALMIAAAGLPVAAMATIVQRASIGYLVCFLFFLLALGFRRRPGRALWPGLITVAVVVFAGPVLLPLVEAFWQKQQAVGLNSRWREALAVLRLWTQTPLTFLFGHGWGATLESPAVGGLRVNFTHNLLTSFALKTGLFGVVAVIAYLGALSVLLVRSFRHSPVIALALAGPFVIDILLYASFKSLGFGLILLLIVLWADPEPPLKEPRRYSRDRGSHPNRSNRIR